jgi:hypothetical protein
MLSPPCSQTSIASGQWRPEAIPSDDAGPSFVQTGAKLTQLHATVDVGVTMRLACISSIAVLALLVSGAPASSAASVHRASSRCPATHSRLIAADTQAEVYARAEGGEPEEFYACAFGAKHVYDLGSGPPDLSAEGGSEDRDFTLGGAMLAFESYWFTSFPEPGAVECEQDVVVKNLRTGRVLHRVTTGTSSPPSLCFGAVLSLLVNSEGATAWVADGRQPETKVRLSEVHLVDSAGSQLLASSTEIEPLSLALGGSTLYWTQGGKPASALVN